jgi:prevent-host-death family protein
VDTVSIRQLRNDVSRIVARVRAGERLIVTLNGVPVAEIGPVDRQGRERTLQELIDSGAVIPPRTRTRPRPAASVRFSGARTTEEILAEHRADRT